MYLTRLAIAQPIAHFRINIAHYGMCLGLDSFLDRQKKRAKNRPVALTNNCMYLTNTFQADIYCFCQSLDNPVLIRQNSFRNVAFFPLFLCCIFLARISRINQFFHLCNYKIINVFCEPQAFNQNFTYMQVMFHIQHFTI